MARTIRVLFKANFGFVSRQASEQEREQSSKLVNGINEKWKKDPGIKFICYYLLPGAGHHMVFEVDDISKVSEMDHDMWATRGILIEDYTLEIALGNTEFDEFWMS